METPVWCLKKRRRYEGLRWNSRARSWVVKVVPDSTIRRIFRTRPSSIVGVNGRGGGAAACGMLAPRVVVSAPSLLAKVTPDFRVRTETSCRDRLVRCTHLD